MLTTMASSWWRMVAAALVVVFVAWYGAHVMTMERRNRIPLHEACFQGDVGSVMLSTRELPSCDRVQRERMRMSKSQATVAMGLDGWNNTALHWAVKQNHGNATLRIIDHLLSCHADIHATNQAGTPVLHWATVANSSALVDALVARGAHANAVNRAGETPLHWAVNWLASNSVRALLRLVPRPNVNALDEHDDTPLHRIPADCHDRPECVDIVRALVLHGANVEAVNAAKRTPLQYFKMDERFTGSRVEGAGSSASSASAPPSSTSSSSSNVRMSAEQLRSVEQQVEAFKQQIVGEFHVV